MLWLRKINMEHSYVIFSIKKNKTKFFLKFWTKYNKKTFSKNKVHIYKAVKCNIHQTFSAGEAITVI